MRNHFPLKQATRALLHTTALCTCLAYASSAAAAEAVSAGDQNNGSSSAAVLSEVDVNAQAKLATVVGGGALGARSILDTPISVDSVSSNELLDRGVASLGQIFAQDASVMSQGDTNTIYSSNISVRGIQLDSDNGYKINGLSIYNFGIELPVQFFDRVELLKGATGFMYGFGAPGGIVNYETAKPTAETHMSADVGYRSDDIWSGHIDLGGPIANDKVGYRINLIAEDGEAPNGGHVDNLGGAISLVTHVNSTLDWTIDGIYQDRRTSGIVQGIGASFYTANVLPSAPSGDEHLPATDGSYFNTQYYFLTTGLHWQVSPDWKISADVSQSGNARRFSFDFDYITDTSGDFTDYVNDSLSRTVFDQAQVMAEGNVKTGPFEHQIVIGAVTEEETSYGSVNEIFSPIGTSNLYNGPSLTYNSNLVPQEYKSATVTQNAIFGSDTIQLTQRLSVLGGVRWTDYQQDGYAATGSGAIASTYSKSPFTPTVAVMYKVAPSTTVYASFVESLEQGTTVASNYVNANALLDPITSQQYEVGAKTDQTFWSGSAAVFVVRRGAGYANAENVYVQNGDDLYRGIDINGRIHPAPDWSIGGSVLLLHADYSNAGPGVQGNRVEGTPQFQTAGDVTYSVPAVPNLSVNANVRYNGDETVDSAAVLKMPGYVLVGLGARYATTIDDHPVVLRAIVDNLADQHYWYFIQSGYMFPGTARTVSLSLQTKF
jgi:iron complex outermembrane receptor protein